MAQAKALRLRSRGFQHPQFTYTHEATNRSTGAEGRSGWGDACGIGSKNMVCVEDGKNRNPFSRANCWAAARTVSQS